MELLKTTTDIDDALEATGASIIDIDTVAVFDVSEKLWGVYEKQVGSMLWELKMTTLNIQTIGG